MKAEREDDFLSESISGFWKAPIKLTENILCKTLLLLRMIDWMILTHLVPLKNQKRLSNYFKKGFFVDFLTNCIVIMRKTESRVCSRYTRDTP